MTPEQYKRVGELYHEAVSLKPEDRAAFLDRECGGDSVVRREVEALVASHNEAQSFLAAPAVAVVAKQLAEEQITLPARRQIGHHRILSLLGKGGMGEVYLAEDTRLSRKVALKVLPAEFTSDAERVRRFEREARAASALSHPNILAIYDIGEQDGTHYITAEYVDGETLRQRCARAKLTPREALDVAVQMASALAAAHEAGIVHRDIKPENVMLRRDGYVKVLDFGLAKLAQKPPADLEALATQSVETTTPGVVMGTVAYMSPEQARGLKVDARTDIWSLGVMLYEMVAGRRPFDGATTSDAIAAILDREPTPLSQLSPDAPAEMERVVAKALEKDRERRYQNAADLLLDLKRLKRQTEIEADSGHAVKTTSGVSGESRRRRRGIALLLIITVVASGIAFGLYHLIGQRPTRTGAARVVLLTSYPGLESRPAFSPDGRQVAFAWNGENEGRYEIYVKLVDAGAPLRLTNATTGYNFYPAWSPDGRHIAFTRREKGKAGIFLVPALGGPERNLFSISVTPPGLIYLSAEAWSPDGKLLAFAARETPQESMSIFLLSVETLEKRKLTSPPSALIGGDLGAAFSPDGKLLAFTRGRDNDVRDIYTVPVTGGEPKQVTFDNQQLTSVTWTPDGRELIFSSRRGGRLELWRVSTSGGTPERVMPGAEGAWYPVISRQGNRLAYQVWTLDRNIWQVEVSDPARGSTPPVRVIYSTKFDLAQSFSPDGKKIAFASDRAGSPEIWVCDGDGSNCAQLTSFGAQTGSPNWSPDGRQVVFDCTQAGHQDIYVVSAEGGPPRRLTAEPSDETRPFWSRDGRWIYFGSNRTGENQVYRMSVEGGPAVQLTERGGGNPVESPDGRFIYFSNMDGGGIWKMPSGGGEATLLLDKVTWGNWAVAEGGIYFIKFDAGSAAIEFLNFATGRMSTVTALDPKKVPYGISVTADGRKIIYSQFDRQESDIMLVENFR
jgi:eukaryotic-like serine/threonine-protein kinase